MERLKPYVTDIVRDYQCGFSKGKSTIDHIHTIRQIAEKHYEYNEDLHLVFVDFKQAYDSISRNKLWKTMENFGIPQKYIALVKMCNINTNFKVRFWQETSIQFKVQTGLLQGDALSPMLFNIALDKMVRDTSEDRKMSLGDLNVLLAYADDIVIIGNSRYDVIQTTRKLLKASKRMGLKVNQQKTKNMCMTQTNTDNSDLEVDNLTFEKVNQFKYLRVNVNSTNIMHNEIKNRLSSANKCYFSLLKLLKSKHLSYESKKILYTNYIRPILTYRCET